METLYFDVLQATYHLGLAILVGGSIVLGAAVAPAIFRGARTRGEAGTLFGAVLGRFEGLAILALVVVALTSVLKFAAFEEGAFGPRLAARWVALLLLAGAVLYSAAWASPIARTIARRTADFDDLPEHHAARREFAALHRSSIRAMQVAIVAGLIALFLS